MCWWLKVSVSLLTNLGSRLSESAADFVCRCLYCLERENDARDQNSPENSETDKHSAQTPAKSNPIWRTNMSDRPLPVPIDNEPYYMNIDRNEAEVLLAGHPDGTFILRPSSQPHHAYTLSVACGQAVHNVGVRRRPDGRLALGFARRGERSFSSITSLLKHHNRNRVLLVGPAGILGSTTLTEPPVYYRTPRDLPLSLSITSVDSGIKT